MQVGNGKKAVEDLLSTMGIDASNPVICLTQDTARSFAGAKSDKEKYELYVKSLHFDTAWENLDNLKQNVQRMKEIVEADQAELQVAE